MKKLRLALPFIILVVIAGFLWRGLQLDPQLLPSALIGKPMPEFVLEDVYAHQGTVSTADLRGQISLLSVWATWCPSCAQEHANKLEIAESAGVQMIGLNYKDDRAQAHQWLAQRGNPYVKNAFDVDGEVGIDLGVYGTPETYLVDAQGIIHYRHVGVLDKQIWQKQFLPRIAELQRL